MEASYQALLSGDAAAFEALIQQLMSADNEARKQAESLLDQLKQHSTDLVVGNLMRLMRQSQNPASRDMGAVMLRKGVVKTELLNCLREEQKHSTLKKIGDTVSGLAERVYDDSEWPELLPFLFECVQSNQPRQMESALRIFADLAGFIMPVLVPHVNVLREQLARCMSHQETDVKIAGLSATTSFIRDLDEDSDRNKFQDLIPVMLQTVSNILSTEEQDSAEEALEAFIEIAEAHPTFLWRQLDVVVNNMLQVAQSPQFPEGIRQLAAEFLVCLCEAREKAPGMMRKLPQYISQLFTCMLLFLLDVTDEAEWHQADSEQYQAEGEGDLYEFGQECLDRIALALGGKTMVPLAEQALPQLMTDARWEQRHAALICLAQIAEGCAKVMLQNKQVTGLGLQDPHAKVRWAACQAVGQMCTDLGPDIQNDEHAVIVPALTEVMKDFNEPRVQAHAAAAIVNFSENCDEEILTGYLDNLITQLLGLLQNGQKLVKEGALTALASVADAANAHFIRYYDTVMPMLKHVLYSASSKAEQLLRAKALECVSLVGMAVGKERFRADAQEVMAFMQQLQSTHLDPDDPTGSYMLQAGARFCKCLGSEFLPYLPMVMPQLIQSASLSPDVTVREQDDDGEDIQEEDEDDDETETLYYGDRKISIRTSVLEEKATACNMLCCYADELEVGFFPYVEQVTQIMVPLLKFYFHEEVRQAAVQAVPELLKSVYMAVSEGKAGGADMQYVKQMLDYVWQPLIESMVKEPDLEVLANMLEAIQDTVRLVGPALLTQEQLGQAFERFRAVLDHSAKRRKERSAITTGEDFDDEEAEALEEENELEEDLLDQVQTCLGAVLEQFGDAAMPLMEGLMPQIGMLLTPKSSVEEKRVGICIMDDIMEHTQEGANKYAFQILPLLLDGCRSPEASIRQSALYGLGSVAEHRPQLFQAVAQDALTRIMAVITAPNSRDDTNGHATENAVSALGKALQHTPNVPDSLGVADLWVQSLPLTVDAEEAKTAHKQLVGLVLAHGTELAESDTADQMVSLLTQMQGSLPPQVFQSFFNSLSAKERKELQSRMTRNGT
ncbi:MAG: Embryo defective [Trebouxia sp. A1-2]|nr:MAG: Embryo defective [Trebouxia sp. A1-2]